VVGQASLRLVVDLGEVARQAAEGSLDVHSRTAETVVEIEMAKSGVEVVAVHQGYDAPAKPDAFGIAGWSVDGMGRFGEFVGLALGVLGGVGGCARFGLVLCAGFAALGQGVPKRAACDTEQKDKPGNCEMAQDRKFWLKHPSTHRFPDFSCLPTNPMGRHR